jgi:energy-coupling factor transport system substrate-specific component
MKVSNPTIIPRIKTAPRFGTLDINNIYTGPDNKATGIGVKRLKKGIIVGLLTFILGFFWGYSVMSVLLSIIVEIVMAIGKYENTKLNTLGYIIYSLSPLGSVLMPWINRELYSDYLIERGATVGFMEDLYASLSVWTIIIAILGTIIMAYLGSLLGRKLIKKQFEKAGIV